MRARTACVVEADGGVEEAPCHGRPKASRWRRRPPLPRRMEVSARVEIACLCSMLASAAVWRLPGAFVMAVATQARRPRGWRPLRMGRRPPPVGVGSASGTAAPRWWWRGRRWRAPWTTTGGAGQGRQGTPYCQRKRAASGGTHATDDELEQQWVQASTVGMSPLSVLAQ